MFSFLCAEVSKSAKETGLFSSHSWTHRGEKMSRQNSSEKEINRDQTDQKTISPDLRSPRSQSSDEWRRVARRRVTPLLLLVRWFSDCCVSLTLCLTHCHTDNNNTVTAALGHSYSVVSRTLTFITLSLSFQKRHAAAAAADGQRRRRVCGGGFRS